MLLTISIPSYNRGHRARALVDSLLKLPYDESVIEIVVSDNGSVKHAEDYKYISELTDPRLRYHRFDENKGYMMNLNQVIRMARGEYCLIISDEDSIVAENLETYLDIMRSSDKPALIKGRTSWQYDWNDNYSGAAGVEALDGFYMQGNYISGIIYNRSILNDNIVDVYEKRYGDNVAYIHYPHMFYDAYEMIRGRFVYSNVPLIIEGEAEGDWAEMVKESNMTPYSAYDSRIDQMTGFFEQIRDLDNKLGDKLKMFCDVCEKYRFLINLVRNSRNDSDEEFTKVLRLLGDKMYEGLEIINLPLSDDDKGMIGEYIESLLMIGVV